MSQEEVTVALPDSAPNSEPPSPSPQVGAKFVGETDPGPPSVVDSAGVSSGVSGELRPVRGQPGAPEQGRSLLGHRPRISLSAWLAGVLLALVVGAIFAILLHLARAPEAAAQSLSDGRTKGAEKMPEVDAAFLSPGAASPGGQVTESENSLETGAAAVTGMGPGSAAELRLRAAVALRLDDCPGALPLYRELEAGETQRPTWSFAVRQLERRCGEASSQGPPVVESQLLPGQSVVDVDLRWDGSEPQEAELRVFRGESLREVGFIQRSARLRLPARSAGLRLELECPEGYAAEESRRQLPPSLPPRLRVRLSCQRETARALLVVLTSGTVGAEVAELEVLVGNHVLGKIEDGVGHFLVEDLPGTAVAVEVRSKTPGILIGESQRFLVLRELEEVWVQTFSVSRKAPARPSRPRPRPVRVPYRL